MSEYPFEPDQFDHEADQVGAHGAHRMEEPFWKQNLSYILIAAAAVIAFIAVLWFIGTLGGNKGTEPAVTTTATASQAPAETKDSSETEATEEATEQETLPAVDKSKPVLLQNGSGKNGLAKTWKAALKAQEWTGIDTGNGQKTDTAGVYYKNDDDLGTATQLAKYLGVEPTKSDDYPSNITVVVVDEPGDLAASETE